MGRSYLIDTNAVIDLLAGQLPTSGEEWLENILVTESVYTSIINRIEVLGFNGPEDELAILKEFLNSIEVIPMTDEIAEQTIKVRKARKIKLPDAVIAATAQVYDLKIISRNIKDFDGIEGVEVINPHEL